MTLLASVILQSHVLVFVQAQDLEVLGVHKALVFIEGNVYLASNAGDQFQVRVAGALDYYHHRRVDASHKSGFDTMGTSFKAVGFLTLGSMLLLSILNCLVVIFLNVGLKDLEQHAWRKDTGNYLRYLLDLEMLSLQLVFLLFLSSRIIAKDLLTNELSAVHIEVEVGSSSQLVVQEVEVDQDEGVLVLVLGNGGPNGEQLLLNQIDLFLSQQ